LTLAQQPRFLSLKNRGFRKGYTRKVIEHPPWIRG